MTRRDCFMSHVMVIASGCWEWQGSIGSGGYGQFAWDRYPIGAHRAAWMLFKGELQEELVLDHLCRNRRCVNPDHLEEVTQVENMRRSRGHPARGRWQRVKTHCPQGHEYDEENTRRNAGRRYCEACRIERRKKGPRKGQGMRHCYDCKTPLPAGKGVYRVSSTEKKRLICKNASDCLLRRGERHD